LQEKVCQGYPLTPLLLFKPYPLLLPDCTDMLCYCYWCLLWLLLLVLLVMLVLVLVLVAVLLLDALLLLPLLVALMLSLLAIPSGMHALAWRWRGVASACGRLAVCGHACGLLFVAMAHYATSTHSPTTFRLRRLLAVCRTF